MFKIKNWAEFQHYKDRNPAWIKLHMSLLSSADWVALDDKSRVLAIACMLIASKTKDGSFENKPDYIQRVAYLNSKPDFKPLLACGFLVSTCEELQADASTLQAVARPEKRREETEERKGEVGVPAVAETKPKKESFKAPSLEECLAYGESIGMAVSKINAFHDNKEANGWLQGKSKMKCWKAGMRYWKNSSFQVQSVKSNQKPSTFLSTPGFLEMKAQKRKEQEQNGL